MDQTHGEEQQTTEGGGAGVATRDDLIAAVRAAGGAESGDVEGSVDAQDAPPGEQQPTTAEEELKIEQILKAREEEHQKRLAARDAAQDIINRAKEEADRVLREAREQAARDAEAERERFRQEFRGSPTATLRALGDPKEIADAVALDGTPEGRAKREFEEKLAKLERSTADGTSAKAEVAELRRQLAEERQNAQIATVRTAFLGQHASQEKTPYMYAEFGGPDGVWNASNEQAREWQEKGLRLGVDFDFDDVAQYVERKAKASFTKKATSLGLIPAQQAGAGAPAKVPGTAPQALANGSRTLPAAAGSERRTAPKPFFELPPDKQREDLIEAVRAAKRQNPDAEF